MESPTVRRRALRVGVAIVFCGLLIGLTWALAGGQAASRADLVQRFQLRGVVASRFLSSYAAGVLHQEQSEGTRWLGAPTVSDQTFVELTENLGFQASVLLDSSGRVIKVYPAKPSLIGQDITGQYRHLRRAVAGVPTVSDVVPSAARAIPVVAFAVPFDTPEGRRVFSGALAVSSSTLGAYLHSLNSVPGTRVYLQDGNGATISNNARQRQAPDDLARTDPDLRAVVAHRTVGTYEVGGVTRLFATQHVSGTRWILVLSVPESTLFAPISQAGAWVSWTSLAGLVILSVTVVVVLARLARLRRDQVRYKDELVSHVSHELRTPLAAGHQFTTIVLDGIAGELNDEQRRYLGIVRRNLDQLGRMVKDLVDSARARDGKLSISPQPFDVGPVLESSVSDLAGRAAHEGIDLRLEAAPGLPAVLADPDRVRQVVSNLLDNAVKFTGEGGTVAVGYGLAADSPSVWVSVSDTGVGLPPGAEEQIFDRLYQTEAGIEHRHGLGLGLHIAKELVERQGGTIRAERVRTGGTRLVFTLPVADPSRYAAPSGADREETRV